MDMDTPFEPMDFEPMDNPHIGILPPPSPPPDASFPPTLIPPAATQEMLSELAEFLFFKPSLDLITALNHLSDFGILGSDQRDLDNDDDPDNVEHLRRMRMVLYNYMLHQ